MNRSLPFYTLVIGVTLNLIPFTPQSIANDIVGITPAITNSTVTVYGKTHRIVRNQKNSAVLKGVYQKIARPCPPYCLQPIVASDAVKTIGELELIKHYQTSLSQEDSVLIDVRESAWHLIGTLPAATHIPLSALEKFLATRDEALLTTYRDGPGTEHFINSINKITSINPLLNFKTLIIFGNGNWSPEAYQSIQLLLKANYPPESILWYRGGAQDWVSAGFELVAQ